MSRYSANSFSNSNNQNLPVLKTRRSVVNVVELEESAKTEMKAKKEQKISVFKNRFGYVLIFLVIAILLFIVDRVTKSWATAQFSQGAIDEGFFFTFTYVLNDGAAFGAIPGYTIFLGAFAAVAVVGMLLWLLFAKNRTIIETVSLGLIAAGALGNMVDRLSTGYVVDFIQFTFIDFPVFNVADICITIGVILLLIGVVLAIVRGPKELRDQEKDEKSKSKSANDGKPKAQSTINYNQSSQDTTLSRVRRRNETSTTGNSHYKH